MRQRARVALADLDAEAPDEAPDPEAVLAAASDAAQVRDCIDRLSDAHRSAIHLAFWGDLSYGEIAEIEGVPIGTVKTRILHAKRLLRYHLDRSAGAAGTQAASARRRMMVGMM
jgi:RNA polymerase sigma-70 factor (ECF subfamily)